MIKCKICSREISRRKGAFMTLDGLTLHTLIRELNERLAGSRIEKIYQPASDDILLLLHTSEGKKRLTLSASGGDCRLNITAAPGKNPEKAPNFCMLLRKYISGGRIERFWQEGYERVAGIAVAARDELGAVSEYHIMCEIMGKYSNIILVKDGMILDSIHRVPLDMSSVRQVLPGMRYQLFPMDKLHPMSPAAELAPVVKSGKIMPFVQGVSSQTERELIYRAFGGSAPDIYSDEDAAVLARTVNEFFEEAEKSPHPVLLKREEEPYFYSVLPFNTQERSDAFPFPSMNEAVDAYFSTRGAKRLLEEKRGAVRKQLKKQRAHVGKILSIQTEALLSKEKSEQLRLYGELLSANIYRVKRGDSGAEVLNYYTGENITIPLDPALSPSANTDAFFKKSNKLKTAAALAKKRCEELSAELSFLEELDYEAAAADTLEDVEEVRLDMMKYGYITEPPSKKKAQRSDPLESPLHFVTSDGFKVFAGRNNRQNDALTFHAAGQEDIWLHAKGIPGSHVILFLQGRPPTEAAINEAASIASLHSKAKGAKTQIDYTEIKNVWKANGAKPGMVLFKAQKTIMADGSAVPGRSERN